MAMLLNMVSSLWCVGDTDVRLSATWLGRFSKTARSHPCHGETRGHWSHRAAPSMRRRSLADDLSESAAEGAQAAEAHVKTNVGDIEIGPSQQIHRPLHPPALQIAVRCLAEGGPESSDEMGFGHAGDASERRDIEPLRVRAIHGVTGAEHAAVRLFDAAAHVSI